MNIRTICIRDIRSKVTHYRETGIFHAHGSVVFWPFFTNNGIFETSFFKCSLPVVDTCNQVRTPLLRGSRVNVIDNLFLGFNQFTSSPFFPFAIFWLQSPANSKAYVFYFLLRITVSDKIICKEAYTLVSHSALHWHFR